MCVCRATRTSSGADAREAVVVNTAVPQAQVAARYAEQGAYPVAPEIEALRAMVPHVVAGAFMMSESLVRHDAERVLLALWPQLAGGV